VEVAAVSLASFDELCAETAVRQCYEETARRAERETLSYERYLLEVITRECEQRRKTRAERLLRESELPLEKSLPNFDVERLPVKAQRQLRTLLEGDFLAARKTCWCSAHQGRGRVIFYRHWRRS
jgi:DNA replication protein DnaC